MTMQATIVNTSNWDGEDIIVDGKRLKPGESTILAKADRSKMKKKIRSVEVETVANGFEIECRFKQPNGNAPYIESTKHVFTDAKEANAFLAKKLGEMI